MRADPTAVLLAPATAEESPELARARRFLDEGELPGALPDEIAEALCEALVRRGAAAGLERLAAGTERALAKRARRGIHLLRTRGVAVEIPAQRRERTAALAEPEAESLMTAPLRDGEYLVWYIQPGAEGGVDFYQAAASELEGLTHFESYHASRKQWRELERAVVRESKLPVAHVPRAYARWLMEEAYRRAVDLGRSPPRAYGEALPVLGPSEAPRRHPILDRISDEEVARAAQAGPIERVLELPEARSFIPDEAAAKRAYQEIEIVATSPLLVDERVRDERVAQILDRVSSETLAGPFRARLARRLLDLGLAVHSPAGGAAPGREPLVEAALCVAASRHVADVALPAGEERVSRALFGRLVERVPVAQQPPPIAELARPGSLIIPP